MFNKYLIEIKNRLFLSVASFFFTFLICYLYKEILLFIVLESCVKKTLISFLYTELTEIFKCYFNISFFFTSHLSAYILFYHLLMFVSSALYKHEYYFLLLIYLQFILNFFLSNIILNYIILPASWLFFLNFQYNSFYNWSFEAKVGEYLDFYKSIYYLIFFNNQIFIIVFYIFTYNKKFTIISIKFRKIFYFIFFINSTVLTPPDMLFQVVFGLLQIFIYEIFIFLYFFKKLIR